ncbi:hypothetical protein V5O48_015714 [Marasmius crinis-equi]|uniref:Uncharacterized protein n=1 Tax=Marasmius crinis-equi TaxID=585013 RepID=A0ABR3ETT5_9AGAR
MQAPLAQPEDQDLQYPDHDSDHESVISAASSPHQPLNPRPPSPPTVFLPSPPTDHQERADRRAAWVTKPNYGGWGDDKVRYLWRFIGRRIWFYVREDWMELPLSWDGVEGRDTRADEFDAERWADWQLYRCSPHAADYRVGPPTFTGPQVQQRTQEVNNHLVQLRQRVTQLSDELSAAQAEVTRYQAVVENLKDLDTLAHGLPRS